MDGSPACGVELKDETRASYLRPRRPPSGPVERAFLASAWFRAATCPRRKQKRASAEPMLAGATVGTNPWFCRPSMIPRRPERQLSNQKANHACRYQHQGDFHARLSYRTGRRAQRTQHGHRRGATSAERGEDGVTSSADCASDAFCHIARDRDGRSQKPDKDSCNQQRPGFDFEHTLHRPTRKQLIRACLPQSSFRLTAFNSQGPGKNRQRS